MRSRTAGGWLAGAVALLLVGQAWGSAQARNAQQGINPP